LRVRITHPHLLDDLARFLERMGFTVEECGYDTVCVERIGEGVSAVVETQLRLYVQVWQATRPEVTATVEAVDAT